MRPNVASFLNRESHRSMSIGLCASIPTDGLHNAVMNCYVEFPLRRFLFRLQLNERVIKIDMSEECDAFISVEQEATLNM